MNSIKKLFVADPEIEAPVATNPIAAAEPRYFKHTRESEQLMAFLLERCLEINTLSLGQELCLHQDALRRRMIEAGYPSRSYEFYRGVLLRTLDSWSKTKRAYRRRRKTPAKIKL